MIFFLYHRVNTGTKRTNLKPKVSMSIRLVLAVFIAFFSTMANAANWEKSDQTNSSTINHSLWQEILDQYLVSNTPSGVNLFNYKNVTSQDKSKLGTYINSLQKLDPTQYNKPVQKAYWINLYNSLTVQLIVDNYPVKSITKLGEKLFAFGPWDDIQITVNGEDLSLNDIEHKILRPIFKDKRIHYAVNCASYSCPNLSALVYTAKNTDSLLHKGECDYVNHPRGVTFNGDELVVSSIYEWYIEDFGNDKSSLIKHLLDCAQPKLKAKLQTFLKNDGDFDHDYNWQLNEPK